MCIFLVLRRGLMDKKGTSPLYVSHVICALFVTTGRHGHSSTGTGESAGAGHEATGRGVDRLAVARKVCGAACRERLEVHPGKVHAPRR